MGTDTSGKRDHQKLKSYIVLDYLMKQSDEEHTISAKDILDLLFDSRHEYRLSCGGSSQKS